MNAMPELLPRPAAWPRWAALLAFTTLFQMSACQEARSMDALKSSRYFSDPAVAAFVDDVQAGNLARVKQGLAAGISPNALGSDGFRPVHFVFVAPKADVLRELLAAGADPNARGENDAPVIHTAIAYTTLQILELLIRGGADINVVWGGNTPLTAAVTAFKWDAAAALLKLNADAVWKNDLGKTAADRFCKHLTGMPVNAKYRVSTLALADAFAARGVALACAAEVQRFR